MNSQNLPPANSRKPTSKKEDSKEQTNREKALEFAKNIPKPKLKPQEQNQVTTNSHSSKFYS